MEEGSNCKSNNLIITTGGTISTEFCDGVLVEGKANIMQFFGEQTYKLSSPFCVLSEDLTFDKLDKLASIIRACPQSNVIVTTGTDNLSATANYLSIALSGTDKSIVIISADKPLSDKASNGHANIKTAKLLQKENIKGVYVVYQNPSSKMVNIHHGSRVMPLVDFTGVCSSANNLVKGFFDGTMINFCDLRSGSGTQVNVSYNAKKGGSVHYVVPHIGFDYKAFNKTIKKTDTVVCSTHHSGTIRTSGANTINDIKCSVLLAGGLNGSNVYKSQTKLNKHIQVINNIASYTLYIKTVLAQSLDKKQITQYLTTNVANEFFGL